MIHTVASRELPLRLDRSSVGTVAAYIAALTVAEAIAAFAAPAVAAALEGALLLVLLGHYLLSTAAETRVLAALALLPLLRLSSLALATGDRLVFLVSSGVPVLVAVVLAVRALELPGVLAPREIRLRSQWQPALAALAVAALAAPALQVAPVAARHPMVATVIVFAFAGVLEELVFRGVIQGSLDPLLGAWSVPLADLLFTAAYLGSGSAPYTIFMAGFGLACGWWVRRTRSLAGAAVGHGLVAVALLVVFTAAS
jgi:membrane protease YdiL (CAAX protease family)